VSASEIMVAGFCVFMRSLSSRPAQAVC
jgi:hypothetical protein